jgi:outer membrane protein assembly factor BamB
LIALLAGLALVAVWNTGTGERQEDVIATAAIGLVTVLLLLVWLLTASRLPWRWRWIGLALTVGSVALLATLTEIRGTTGDLVPILAWKWTPEPGRQLAAHTPSETEPVGEHRAETGRADSGFLDSTSAVTASTDTASADKGSNDTALAESGIADGNLAAGAPAEPEPADGGLSDDAAAPAHIPAPFDRLSGSFPQFLGPHRDAIVPAAMLPDGGLARDWQAQPPREVWRRAVGAGWSGFAISGATAVTQEQRGDREAVVAYELDTGRELWSDESPARYEAVIAGLGPRATPTIDAGRVFAQGATGLLTALDLASGRRLWQRDVLADHGAENLPWGTANSPLVHEGQVIVSAGGSGGTGTGGHSLAAYDAATGDPLWSGGDDPAGYSSPRMAELAGRRQIVIFNARSVTGHDPADGAVLWRFPWPGETPTVAMPVQLDDHSLLLSSGYGIGAKRIEIVDDGGSLRAELVWESPRLKAKFANFLLYRGFVYGLDDGVLVCLDPATGERRWKRGRYGHGQLLLAGDLLLVTGEQGDLVLIDPNPDQLTELAVYPALTGKSWNPAALAGQYFLWRNDREAVLLELPSG